MAGTIHVAIPADDRYWCQALVTASSAVRGSSLPIIVHILDGGISTEHKAEMSSILRAQFHPLEMARLAHHGRWHGSSVAWSRLWLAEILPVEVEWVISCDADVLFRGDIAKLWSLRDARLLVQGSSDSLPPWMTKNPEIAAWCERVGRDYGDPAMFFCSGITLMNLKGIRETNGTAALERFAEENPGVPFLDQTALNLVFKDCKGVLPRNWGCFSGDQNADVDYNGDCAIHYVNDQPWARRKLTHLVSDVVLLWWHECKRVDDGQLSFPDSKWRGCSGPVDYAWRRGLWLVLRVTSWLWRYNKWMSWHFRNALPK